MEDSRRAGPGKRPGEAGNAEEHATTQSAPPASESQPPKRTKDIRFIGGAMKSLFESADVSVRRDDETRVLSRAQEALAELEQRRGIKIAPAPLDHGASSAPPSRPPGPRVDVVLWVVLVVGLFGIAGWMLLYGL